MIEINSQTKQLAIIGNPVSHSFSPKMHTYIAQKMGINCVYTALLVEENELENAIKGIRALNILGVNITSPYKTEVINYLDEISEDAKLFSSVNTCVNRNGKLYGYNTDAQGLYRSLMYEGVDVEGKDILIIGAGGVTQPIVMYFAKKGAKSISIENRTKEKALKICENVKKALGYSVNTGIDKEHYDIVINTTTVGMHPDISKSPVLDMPYADENTCVVDLIYNPFETQFLKIAKSNGAKTINGLGMLIFQGIIAFELFTDTKLPNNIYEDILKDVFDR